MPTDAGNLFPHDASRALFERASQGDTNAVEQLLAQHLPGLRAYVRFKEGAALLARESSSDLVQSVCRDVLENAARFRYEGEGAFRKWLFTTALRKIADRHEHYTRLKREAAREQSTGGDDALL